MREEEGTTTAKIFMTASNLYSIRSSVIFDAIWMESFMAQKQWEK